MGMSASQSALLQITARIHDIEYKAQAIEAAKVDLATRKDEVYENYISKLDAKKIQVAFGMDGVSTSYVDATFANVCQFSTTRTQQYALRDAESNKVVVPEKVYDVYNDGFNSDKYAFAWAMLGLDGNFSWEEDQQDYQGRALGINTNETGGEDYENWNGTPTSLLMTDVEQKVYEAHEDTLKGLYDKFKETDSDASKSYSEKRKAFDDFRNKLYSDYGSEIYKYMVLDKTDESNTDPDNGSIISGFKEKEWLDIKSEFNYYVNLFEEIQNNGGCISVTELVGDDGASGNEWFNDMIKSGKLLIDTWSTESKEWVETSVATSFSNNFLQEVNDDLEVKKAEAEYEHELKIINDKDKKFDNDLKNLETERSSLKAAMEGIEQVKNDNVERTFGIFS